MQGSYISLHNFTEQLTTFVEHLPKAASVFWKAGQNFRETSGIITQIASSSLEKLVQDAWFFEETKK